MFSKSLDVFKILLIILAMVIGYTTIKNMTEPVVCFFTSCKAELEQTVENQKQKIKDLEKTIEDMKKNHQVELDNLKNNKEVIQEVQDSSKSIDERKNSAIDQINLTILKSKPAKKQVINSKQDEKTKVAEPDLPDNTVSLTDEQKSEIQIDAIWEMYCSSDYVTCKG